MNRFSLAESVASTQRYHAQAYARMTQIRMLLEHLRDNSQKLRAYIDSAASRLPWTFQVFGAKLM